MEITGEKCIKCGREFPRGPWAQSVCDPCSMHMDEQHYYYRHPSDEEI